jgi:hypothetical protein
MFKRILLFTSFALLALAPAASAHGLKVVASGLDNPRGIDLARSGALYVAEAGRGGDGACIPGGEGGEVCVGSTGAITRVGRYGHQRRVVRGLPSTAGEGGAAATGPQDVDVSRFGYGSFVTGLAGSPDDRATLGEAGAGLGHLYAFSPFGRAYPRADLAAYEGTADPDKDIPGSEGVDSNPTGVLNEHHGTLAIDAGGNDLLRVGFRGGISTLAVFGSQFVDAPPFLGLPPGTQIPSQAVPTAVAKGPDGAYYVSQLTGFPFPPGKASIFRVVPGRAPTVYAAGLTNVTDLDFGRDGSLYVVEISKAGLLNEASETDSVGDVIRIARNGNRRVVADNLASPYGVAVGRRGDVFVTTHSTSAGAGEVVRVR